MRTRFASIGAASSLAVLLALAGCSSILGFEDFTVLHDDVDAGPVPIDDAAAEHDASAVPTAHDAGNDADATTNPPPVEAGPDAPIDHSAPDADGGLTCDAGLTVCGTACIDTATSGANCGACGHTCLGGTCAGSQCQPTTVSAVGAPGYELATDAKNVYFLSIQGILSCAKTGCGTAPAGPFATAYTFTLGGHLVYDTVGSLLYATGAIGNNYDTFSMQTDGGNLGQFDTSTSQTCVGVDADSIYWYSGGIVYRRNRANGPIIQVMSGLTGCEELAIDDSAVYVTDGTNLNGCTKGNGLCSPPNVLASAGSPKVLATEPDSNNVFFAFNTTIYRCPTAGCPDPAKPTPWVTKQASVAGIVVDAANVYWMDQGKSSLLKCALGATCAAPVVMASGLNSPISLAQDATALYWTLGSGSIGVQKLAK